MSIGELIKLRIEKVEKVEKIDFSLCLLIQEKNIAGHQIFGKNGGVKDKKLS